MKNIILLSDGTGNGAAKSNKTNVWRLYEALDLHRTDQIAYYDDGVGSQEFLPLKIMGGAFGFGLKRNILELYKFLCRNYEVGDKIYLFGFSRGAFTVRMLAGLIGCCGLYTGYKDEADLNKRARNNYYRLRTHYNQTPFSRLFCKLTDIHELYDGTVEAPIEFIGVWDTVDAYGFPIDELADIWDKFIFPIRFPDQRLSTTVHKACHALSIDDERHTFHPVLWDEKVEEKRVRDKEVDEDRIEQVWFAGVHTDVGGGYPMNNLSLVTLDWMMSKVEVTVRQKSGLYFISQLRADIMYHSDWHGKQHDSRAGAGAYYRYRPRMIGDLCHDRKDGVCISDPKIHRSVLERIKENVVTYAPIGLPSTYQVVTTRGEAIDYEDDAQKKRRVVAMDEVQELVVWRKRLYYAILLTTLTFLLSRFFLEWSPEASTNKVECILDLIWIPLIAVLPDLTSAWFEALKQNTAWGWGFITVFVTLFIIKRKLWSRTQMKSIRAWDTLKRGEKVVTKAQVEK